MRHRRTALFAVLPCLVIAVPAVAAPWWYAGRGADRVVFVDAGSVERDGTIVTFAAKTVIRRAGDPVAMTVAYMRGDCAKRQLGWSGTQRIGYDEAVIDTSTVAAPHMVGVPAESLADAELGFACACSNPRKTAGAFVLAIDDAAFTTALLSGPADLAPRALHDRLAADPAVPVIRSSAPAPATFGHVQTVKRGQPMVPPRDYEMGPQIPQATDYQPIEVGRIYDIAYQGIADGRLQFEVRGYSIDDLVHPGSGTTETADRTDRTITIRDLAITIRTAQPDRITYSVAIAPRQPQEPPCPPDGCGEPVAVDAADLVP